MARFISFSVGRMGGKNEPHDVVTVQHLLNQAPAGKGGAQPLLDVDGLCGPKTINAIQKFQLHHFGWPGADGRVDPAGPTIVKLNEFDGQNPAAPVPITTESTMKCPHFGSVKAVSLRKTLVLTTSDQFVIAGCTFPNSPCVQVRWAGPPGRPLNSKTSGMCLNSAGAAQGPVIVTTF
jgi:putative peptidoglycan binding protein